MKHTFINNNTIPEIILIKTEIYEDHRGSLYETYNKELFTKNGIPEIVQEKCSRSEYKVLRGLHYQKDPYGQGKLIRCNRGKIFDVAVDIRQNSSTYKQWVSYELSEDNKDMVYIPPGFAHGILVLSENGADFSYFTTEKHYPKYEGIIKYNDPSINIQWPITSVILSDKDNNHHEPI
jgi:dTDP-4-dehydrorhamnose 3,5-epimerase